MNPEEREKAQLVMLHAHLKMRLTEEEYKNFEGKLNEHEKNSLVLYSNHESA